NHLTAFQKGVGHIDGLIEKTARIEAEVENIALQLVGRNVCLDLLDRLLQVVIGLFREGNNPHVADVTLDARFYGAYGNDFTNDGDIERLIGAFTKNGQLNRRIDGAAHLLDGILELEAADGLSVDLGDQVACEDTCT